MAATPSNMIPLGTLAPAFRLENVNGGKIEFDPSSRQPVGNGFMICFICNHCPFVKHIESELISIVEEAERQGIKVFAISSNDIEKYPDDAPEFMTEKQYPFPYLFDETQEVAKAFDAACTPDFYLFDEDYRLVYRGQMDNSRPGNDQPVDGKDLRAAIEALLSGEPPLQNQHPSIGCNIKWK
jgi:peroxiredoxin